MSVQPLVPVWVIVVGAIVLLALCIVGWQRAREVFGSARSTRIWAVRAGLVAVVAALALGPSFPRDEVETYSSGVEVYLVVDRTGSMAAEDYTVLEQDEPTVTTRLAGVRADIAELVQAYPGAEFSIISFDSVASQQLPLTTDTRAVLSWTQTVQQEPTMYSQGSLVDRPLNTLTRALNDSIESTPDHVRLVYFFSDGENTAEGTPESYAPLANAIGGGAVLGYGTEQGGKMKIYDPSGAESGYITDPTLEDEPPAISVLDPGSLQTVAAELDVPLLIRDGTQALDAVFEQIDTKFSATASERSVQVYQVVVWPFALAGVVLILLDIAGIVRRMSTPVGVVKRG